MRGIEWKGIDDDEVMSGTYTWIDVNGRKDIIE